MNAITSLTAVVLGASLATMAMAQTQPATDIPPAEAGAGAAAATSGAVPAVPEAEAETAEAEPEPAGTVPPGGIDTTAVEELDGRWRNAEGIPTFKVEGAAVDFATFNGFRRYTSECSVCHGPDGEGSTYAPALKESVLRMDYYDFMQVVASGRQGTNSVMPAFATNRNVWCYVDDIYTYLVARGTDTVGRGRPAERTDKSEEYTAQEDSCMSG